MRRATSVYDTIGHGDCKIKRPLSPDCVIIAVNLSTRQNSVRRRKIVRVEGKKRCENDKEMNKARHTLSVAYIRTGRADGVYHKIVIIY